MKDQDQQFYSQFLQLLSITEDMQQRILSLEKSNEILLRSQRQFVEWMDDTLSDIAYFQENVQFEIMDKRVSQETKSFWYPQVATLEETMRCLIEDQASIARFGDGEFEAMQGRSRHKFQTTIDENLADRLKEVLESDENNFLIAIADNYGSLASYTNQAKREIRHYMTRSVRLEHLDLLKKDRIYYNAYITRPYVMYKDHFTNAPAIRFERIKQIWSGRKCVFVEGSMTGMGVGNDLFQNADSIQRILVPAENAYSKYNQILAACLNQPKSNLFLLAVGPTATVLAYDLHHAGYQAVDVGHIDLEYEWFLKDEGCRTSIDKKYNNEVAGGETPQAIEDKEYFDQIIADFSQI